MMYVVILTTDKGESTERTSVFGPFETMEAANAWIDTASSYWGNGGIDIDYFAYPIKPP